MYCNQESEPYWRGTERKSLKNLWKEKGENGEGLCTQSTEASNYPEIAELVANAVASGECERGILICGTGVGISIAANKVHGIRAVCCSEPFSAKMAKEHNNANILCFGARVVGSELAKMIVENWMDAEFQGGRHAARVDMIHDIEKRQK